MKKMFIAAAMAAYACNALAAQADDERKIGKLSVELGGIQEGKTIPAKFAFCQPDGRGHTKNADNISPEISWHGAPEGTKSFVIISVDKDVPATFELANKDDKVIPKEFPRQDFYHWVLVDVPATLDRLPEGKASNGIVEGGKPFGKTEYGIVGQNDYKKVGPGKHGGYDGPCPPWNDEVVHRYHFIVYALDVGTLSPPKGAFDGRQVDAVMRSHILAQGEIVGTYSNNLKILDHF